MIGPEGAYDEVVDSGEGLVPGVVEPIVLGLEVDQSCGLHTDPLKEKDMPNM